MDSLNQHVHAYGSSRPGIGSVRKDYPSEVEEVYRQDSLRLTYKRVRGLAEEQGLLYPLHQRK